MYVRSAALHRSSGLDLPRPSETQVTAAEIARINSLLPPEVRLFGAAPLLRAADADPEHSPATAVGEGGAAAHARSRVSRRLPTTRASPPAQGNLI